MRLWEKEIINSIEKRASLSKARLREERKKKLLTILRVRFAVLRFLKEGFLKQIKKLEKEPIIPLKISCLFFYLPVSCKYKLDDYQMKNLARRIMDQDIKEFIINHKIIGLSYFAEIEIDEGKINPFLGRFIFNDKEFLNYEQVKKIQGKK